jgi:hypothetical protein
MAIKITKTIKGKKVKYHHTTQFWEQVKDSVALFTPTAEVIILTAQTNHVWNYINMAAGAIVYLLGKWMVDKDNNGIVDLYQQHYISEEVAYQEEPIENDNSKQGTDNVTITSGNFTDK